MKSKIEVGDVVQLPWLQEGLKEFTIDMDISLNKDSKVFWVRQGHMGMSVYEKEILLHNTSSPCECGAIKANQPAHSNWCGYKPGIYSNTIIPNENIGDMPTILDKSFLSCTSSMNIIDEQAFEYQFKRLKLAYEEDLREAKCHKNISLLPKKPGQGHI